MCHGCSSKGEGYPIGFVSADTFLCSRADGFVHAATLPDGGQALQMAGGNSFQHASASTAEALFSRLGRAPLNLPSSSTAGRYTEYDGIGNCCGRILSTSRNRKYLS